MNVVIGKKASGKSFSLNLSKLSTVLVTGTGESSFVKTVLSGLTKQFSPDNLKLCLMTPKKADLETYEASPYLMAPVAHSVDESTTILALVDHEMRQRYYVFSLYGVKNFEDYQKKGYPSLPHIVVVFEGFPDSQSLQPLIIFLSQMAKAAGICMILTTQTALGPVAHINALEGGMLEINIRHKRDLVTILETERMD